jgi:hypothetical protein
MWPRIARWWNGSWPPQSEPVRMKDGVVKDETVE